MSLRHDELTQAITERREDNARAFTDAGVAAAYEQSAHLDTLQTILDLHQPEQDDYGVESCRICLDGDNANQWAAAITSGSWWPCKDAQLVESALRNMGAIA